MQGKKRPHGQKKQVDKKNNRFKSGLFHLISHTITALALHLAKGASTSRAEHETAARTGGTPSMDCVGPFPQQCESL